jgi:hypothetical protein
MKRVPNERSGCHDPSCHPHCGSDPVLAWRVVVADKPGKGGHTEDLMKYWAEGEGAAKIAWGSGGDFNRCRANLGKYVQGNELDGLCANLHHRATGAWPGHAPGEKLANQANAKNNGGKH